MGAGYDILLGAGIGVALIVVFNVLRYIFNPSKPWQMPEPIKIKVGPITEETLKTYAGYDITKPLLVAVRGKLYDVSKDTETYGPGKLLHVFAGREVARALALGSTAEGDCSGRIDDLTREQLQLLDEKEAEFAAKYDRVGEVEPLQELSLDTLATFDGRVEDRPIYLAILGKVYDVSAGRMFYGPDGMYPFAGKECARALALMSTDLKECTDDLDGLGYTEKDTLREWQAKFDFKYPVVGRIVTRQS